MVVIEKSGGEQRKMTRPGEGQSQEVIGFPLDQTLILLGILYTYDCGFLGHCSDHKATSTIPRSHCSLRKGRLSNIGARLPWLWEYNSRYRLTSRQGSAVKISVSVCDSSSPISFCIDVCFVGFLVIPCLLPQKD